VDVLSKLGAGMDEAAEHVAQAQAQGSPGAFTMLDGTRAFAGAGTPLQRLKNARDLGDPNRTAACLAPDALIRIRPPNASATCAPDRPGCQCDEYPYNASYQGAAYLPDTTSVKWINGQHNNNAGGIRLKNWLKRERVLDLGSVPADSPSGLPLPGSSDPFWVYVK
jgi:hypothetical protein